MKMYCKNVLTSTEKGFKYEHTPDSNSRCKSITMLVAKELAAKAKDGILPQGTEVNVGMIGKDKNVPMLFPVSAGSKKDSRILVFADQGRPYHRGHGSLESDVAPLLRSSGGGAWGSGEIGWYVLEEGQSVTGGNWRQLWENIEGELKYTAFDTKEEYEAYTQGTENVTFL